MEYKYKKVKGYEQNKFTENGHTMFESDVLQRLKSLEYLEKKNKDLIDAIQRALSISDLWTYGDEVEAEFIDEAIVLGDMKILFEKVLKIIK